MADAHRCNLPPVECWRSHAPTWLVTRTSTSARAASFRPEAEIGGTNTRILAEQVAAVDPGRLGKSVGFLSFDAMRRLDAALRIVLDL